MAKPTYQDADLMVKMARWGTELEVQDIGNWVWSDEFIQDYEEFNKKYPDGSEEQRKLYKFFSWYETLGTLYKHGLFNKELLFDWLFVTRVWARVENIVQGARDEIGSPRLLENFELMAKDGQE